MFICTYIIQYLKQEFSVGAQLTGFHVICFACSRIFLLSQPALVKLEKSLRQALILHDKCQHFYSINMCYLKIVYRVLQVFTLMFHVKG